MLSKSNSKGPDGFVKQPLVKKRRRRRRGGEEEEPVLRTTCDNCTSAKVKCNGEQACMRCKNKDIKCEYTFKKRCGPKRRKGVAGAGGTGDSGGLLAAYAKRERVLGLDDHLHGMATALNKDEVECVDVFMQNINNFLPLTSFEMIKRAATPAPHQSREGIPQDTDDEERNQLLHARRALLHGVIAVGAEYLDKEEASVKHAGIARQEIKECFDAAVPELVGAYLMLALYWTHQMDSAKIARYIGLAHQSKGIICDPPAELVASLSFVSVFLYDAKVLPTIGCRIHPPGPVRNPGSQLFNTPTAYQQRVLNILSFVLLAIHNRSNPMPDPAISTGDWNPKALAEHVDEAKALLARGATAGPNEMCLCVVVVLQAYFLLLSDNVRQAVTITEPLAYLVGDNPLVLHLPIVWSMMGCVRTLLGAENRTIAVERLQLAMEPLASHLGFATDESMVERELRRVFVGKKKVGEASAAPLERGAMLVKNRAQTSSLNVTAEDYSHRNRSPMDLVAVEPSPAPHRRSITSSTNHPSGRGVRVSITGTTPSLISPPILASSPPPSRVGVLTRAPATRGSLSTPHPFERSPASLLQLDLPYTSSYPDAAPGIVPQSAEIVRGHHVPPFRPCMLTSRTVTEDEVEVEVGKVECEEGDALLDEAKFGADRRELMTRQQVQPSFKADAPVSLEQVESNMARLGVSPVDEGEAALNRLVTSMDLDAAAELIATKTSYIS